MATACYTAMNIVWLQSAPTAFASLHWRFYLIPIVFDALAAPVIWLCFPDTRGKPLEEVAALFGDEDLVAVFQRDIDYSVTFVQATGEKARSQDNIDHTEDIQETGHETRRSGKEG